MAEIGSLQVRIGADTSGLEQGVDRSEGAINRLGGFAAKGALALAKVGVAAAAAGKALTIALTKQGLDAADAQAKLARSMDATADGLRGVQIAAERAGVSTGAVNAAAQQMNRELARAAREGAGPAADALNRLGLNARDLIAMDVDQRMATIADRAHEMGLSSGEASDMMRSLGIRSREMALLMIDGGDAIRQARQDVDDFGLSLSDVDAANIERANDALADVMRHIEVVRQRLAAALAPVIEMVSNRFLDTSREAGGFRDAIDRGIAFGVRAFAQLANAVEVIRRAFIVLGGVVTTVVANQVRGLAMVADAVITGPVDAVNVLIRALNRVRGISVEEIAPPELSARLREIADEAGLHMEGAQERIRKAFTEPLPGDAIQQAYADAVEAANASSAEQIAAQQERNRVLAEMDEQRMEDVREAAEEENEVNHDALQRRLDRLRESLMTEEELEAHRFQQRLQELQSFHDAAMIDEDQYYDKLEQLAEQHENRMNRIREQSADKQSQTARGLAEDLFGQNKAASLANAILSAREAIAGAYAVGARRGGPPLGAAFAAAAGAAQFAQVSAIRSTSLSGGGAGTAVAAGGAAVAAQASAQAAGPTQTLQVSGISPGDIFTGQAVRELAGRLLEFQQDGGRVVFAD